MSRCCHETGRNVEFGQYASAWPVRKIGDRYEYFFQGAFLDYRVHDRYRRSMKQTPEEINGIRIDKLKGVYLIAIKDGESRADPSRKNAKFLDWELGKIRFPKTFKDFMDWVACGDQVEWPNGKTIDCWHLME
jgi:hypothetical protein